MALITRLARLWRADINALLDRLEAPELVLGQAVREMEQALDGDRRGLAHLRRELARLGPQECACSESLGQAESALLESLAQGREDLARALIRRRLESERGQRRLGLRRAELESELDRVQRRVVERESQLAELRARAAAYQDPAAGPDADPIQPWVSPIGDEEVEIHLLRAKRLLGGLS